MLKKPNKDDLNKIIDGCINGKQKFQHQLYSTFASKMYGVACRYASSDVEAQDILQDSFVKVFQKLKTFKREGSLEGWIRRIVVNTALDCIRKNKNSYLNVDLSEAEYLAPDKNMILANLNAEEILQLLKTIPVGYRTVFNLYAIEGYSHKEIADKLEISENTSKSQYSRAKAFLRKLVEQYEMK